MKLHNHAERIIAIEKSELIADSIFTKKFLLGDHKVDLILAYS